MSVVILPPRTPIDEAAYGALHRLIDAGAVAVLTGAGMSTASGIPDYRGPDGTRRVQPMQHGEFIGSAGARRRYWARSHAGWLRFSAARPNHAHVAVAQLERAGLLTGIITQNVDGLHQRAGARDVLELHGTLARVGCLTCGETYRREDIHEWLEQANPGFIERMELATRQIRPDGDLTLGEDDVAGFRMVSCLVCGGDVLKPEVVFFGGNVERAVVDRGYHIVERARALLVLGSSLAVMSGYRFVRRAKATGTPVAIVTCGPSRGDGEATVRMDALLGEVLPRLVDDLT